jgi:hypothetical protein
MGCCRLWRCAKTGDSLGWLSLLGVCLSAHDKGILKKTLYPLEDSIGQTNRLF